MNETIVYVTGSPSFKSAVTAQLASEWITTGPNVARALPSFSLPDAVPLEQFKSFIGTNRLSDRNLLFFSEVQVNHVHNQGKPTEKDIEAETSPSPNGSTVPDQKKNKK